MSVPRLGRQAHRYKVFFNLHQDARFTRCAKWGAKPAPEAPGLPISASSSRDRRTAEPEADF